MRSAFADFVHFARRGDLRVERSAVVAVVLLYVLVGLVGHDPWKQDDTYVTSIISHIDHTEDRVVLQSAGRPFMEKPPLYCWPERAWRPVRHRGSASGTSNGSR